MKSRKDTSRVRSPKDQESGKPWPPWQCRAILQLFFYLFDLCWSFVTYAEERLTRRKHAQSWEKTHLKKIARLFTIWIIPSSYIGYKIKDHRFSTPYTDNQAIHTIINDDHHCHLHDQRNHHLYHQYLPGDQNSPFQSLSGRQPPQDQQQALHLFCSIWITHLSPM